MSAKSSKGRTTTPAKSKGSHRSRNMLIGTAIILAVTIVSFVLVPAFSGGASGQSLVFGRYGNREIAYVPGNYFTQRIEAVNEYYRDSSLVGGDVGFLRQVVWRQAFNETVLYESILYGMDASDFVVSPRSVDRAMVERGPFSIDGRFDKNLYAQASASEKQDLRERFQQELTFETWSSDVMGGIVRNDATMNFIEDLGKVEREYDFVAFTFSSYPEEDVRSYAAANSGIFSEIRLSRITVETEEQAGQIVARLDAQELPFDELARDESRDSYAEDGGLIGWTRYYELTELISSEEADELFSKTAGDIAGPFETRFGWVVFRVEQASTTPQVDEIIDEVRAYMETQEVGLLEDAMLARAEAFRTAASESSFGEAAEVAEVEVASTGFFPLNYGGESLIGGTPDTSTNPILAGATRSDEFWINTLSLPTIGDISEPTVLGNAVLVFRLKDLREAETYPPEWSQWRRSQMEAEFIRTRQNDLQGIVLDSPLLKDDFSSAYVRVFPQG